MEKKSYNVVALDLLKMYKQGVGLHQGMRKADITEEELAICMGKNAELNTLVETKFNITAAQIQEKQDNTVSELEELRARAVQLGVKNATIMGMDKLKLRIEEKEAEIAAQQQLGSAPASDNSVNTNEPDETGNAPDGDANPNAPAANGTPDAGNAPDGNVGAAE